MKAWIVFVLVAALALGGIFAMSSVSASYAMARQAQAAIEASRATQVVAASNLVLALALLVLGMLAGAVIGVVVFMRLRSSAPRHSTQGTGTRWVSGPNAGWRLDDSPAGMVNSLRSGVDPQQVMLTALAIHFLQNMPTQAHQPVGLLAERPDALDEEDWSDVWDGLQ